MCALLDLNELDEASHLDLLADLQCNTLTSHRRNRAVHLLFELPPDRARSLRTFFAEWSDPSTGVTPLSVQLSEEAGQRDRKRAKLADPTVSLGQRGVVRSLMFSAAGMARLKVGDGMNVDRMVKEVYRRDQAFLDGQLSREAKLTRNRVRNIGMTADWETVFKAGKAHVHVLLAADGDEVPCRAMPDFQENLRVAVAHTLKRFADQKALLRQTWHSYMRRDANGFSKEHFGFADGISMPRFLRSEAEYHRLNRPDPDFGHTLANVLVALSTPSPTYGSFCVLRRIKQDVAAFSGLAVGDQLQLVGREKDGRSLVAGAGVGRSLNDFVYPLGAEGCPFHAHVRKANPRRNRITVEDNEVHFPRRAMIYGDRGWVDGTWSGEPLEEAGLMFMGYMGSIENQFEVVQRDWLNNPSFTQAGDGVDALAGFPSAYLETKGGEHFFVPPRSWLRALGDI